MAEKKKNFIQKMGLKKGALHNDLGIKEGEKIPKARLEAAANSPDKKVAKRAETAMMLEGLSKKKKTPLRSSEMKKKMYSAKGK